MTKVVSVLFNKMSQANPEVSSKEKNSIITIISLFSDSSFMIS
jgi:hypothetical protein